MESNTKFRLNLSLGKDIFNFNNKELDESSWKKKKKSPSQLRIEKRRKEEREKTKEDTEEVSEKSDSNTMSFKCDYCESNFKSEEGLKIHVGKAHKTEASSVPEKERGVFPQKEPLLTLTPARELREEVDHTNIYKLVFTECGEFWGPPTSACSTASSDEQQVKWKTLCSSCWTNTFPKCPNYYRFCN